MSPELGLTLPSPSVEAAHSERELPSHVYQGPTVESLREILNPSRNLAIWTRLPDKGVRTQLQNVVWPESFFSSARINSQEMPNSSVLSNFISGIPGPNQDSDGVSDSEEALQRLSKDIRFLAHFFSRLAENRTFQISLMTIESTMCPAFHADSYEMRLITTYFGPTTLWTPDDNVNPDRMSSGYIEDRLHNPKNIHSMPDYSVAIMKGNGFDGNTEGGLVHRSPDLAPGDTRLVLRMEF
jgi:hypothetical protein